MNLPQGWSRTNDAASASRLSGVPDSAFAESCWTNGTDYVCVYSDELRDSQGRPYAVGWVVHYRGVGNVVEVVDVDDPTSAGPMAKQMMRQISGASRDGSEYGEFGPI